MKVHYSYDVKRVAVCLVDDRIWESMEIEFAVPTCRSSYQSAAASSS
jgi:hypothetical protein